MKSEPVIAASNNHLDQATQLGEPTKSSLPGRQSSLPPRSKGWSRRRWWLTGGAAFFVVAAAVATILLIRTPLAASRTGLNLYKVTRKDIDQTIQERGTLESGNNSDIYCRVKAGNKNTTVSTTIKYVVDDGSPVKGAKSFWGAVIGKGDIVVELDDSGLVEQRKSQKITVDKARSDMVQAENNYKITLSQNESDLESAIGDVMKYTGLPREDVLKPAVIADVKDYLEQQAKLTDKVKTILTDYQKDMPANPDKAFLTFRQEALKKALAELRLATCFDTDADVVLKKFTRVLADRDLEKFGSGDYRASLQDAMGQIENAQSDLSQQEDREAWALRMAKKGYQTASQAQAETLRKESYLLTLNKANLSLDVLVRYGKQKDLPGFIRTLEKVQQQNPAKKERDHSDMITKQSIFQQESDRLDDVENEIRKCKITASQDGMVVYFIPEQARGGGGSQQSIVAQGEPVREGQKLMQIPDLKNMLVNTKVHEALMSRLRKPLPGQKGQPAIIRVESVPNRELHGWVVWVSEVPAAQDFFAADVKVYPTKVAIDPEDIKDLNLKPGMSADVKISVSQTIEQVLAVPIQAVVGGSEMGDVRKVVVMTADGPQEREVHLGASNTTLVEIKDGLVEGDEVVLNPKAVLGDKAKTRDDPAAGKGKGGGGRGDGKGGPPSADKDARPPSAGGREKKKPE